MSKSITLRSSDWRAILRLSGECREQGDDPHVWRRHALASMAGLVDAELGCAVEALGVRKGALSDTGVTGWSIDDGFDWAAFHRAVDEFRGQPSQYACQRAYFASMAEQDGICRARTELVCDREWYRSVDHVTSLALGVDHNLWCFRPIGCSGGADVHTGVILHRARGRRDFSARDMAIVREAQAALATAIGAGLARYTEPSARELPPRVRQVLRALLEGDSDKQVAARLRLSTYTVNEYTKVIYRHFAVSTRAELLARWVRRGWSVRAGQ